MPEHRIRLNRAWEIRAVPLDSSVDDLRAILQSPVDQRLDLPLIVDAEPADDNGQPVRLLITRWFNSPSNLRPGQSVRVVVEPAALVLQLRLNEGVVAEEPASVTAVALVTDRGSGATLACDLTGKLQRHNRLDILVGDAQSLSTASVALVIEE